MDRASGFPGDPPLLPRGPLQGAIWGQSWKQMLLVGPGVCGSRRLRKRVYGEASFTEASAVTGSLPVAVKAQGRCIF